jgi:chorismate dehydratase
MVEGVPSKCAELLAEGDVDAALVPVIEYQRANDVLLIPDVCVGSKNEVRSVVLVSTDAELETIRSIALDHSSRTSAAMLKILFREFLGTEPKWATYSPQLSEMLNDNDAALIIGDPGMTFPREGLRVWDMASLWRKYTDLGFVFAMWMIRSEDTDVAQKADFAAAKDEGLENKAAIVEQYRQQLSLAESELDSYLTNNITFTPDESMLAGLKLYFKLAHKHKLIPELKPLNFVTESV